MFAVFNVECMLKYLLIVLFQDLREEEIDDDEQAAIRASTKKTSYIRVGPIKKEGTSYPH